MRAELRAELRRELRATSTSWKSVVLHSRNVRICWDTLCSKLVFFSQNHPSANIDHSEKARMIGSRISTMNLGVVEEGWGVRRWGVRRWGGGVWAPHRSDLGSSAVFLMLWSAVVVQR